jgi:hypothetical protein
MPDYNKIYEELRKTYSDKEIAEGYMIPETLSKEEQQSSDEAFRQKRFELLNSRTEKQRILSEIMRLRVKVFSYLEEDFFLLLLILVKFWANTF